MDPENARQSAAGTLDPSRILWEDPQMIAVNKPAGVVCAHPDHGPGRSALPSLWDQLKQYLKVKYAKPGNVFLGVVHRIDQPTSGCVVYARTSKAAARLSEQFRLRTTQKWYLAMVQDPLEKVPAQAHWQDWLIREESLARTRISRTGAPGAQQAQSVVYRLGQQGSWKLLALQLGTGRKHQLRAQLGDRGAAILGDHKYGSTIPFPEGIALHAWQLTVTHPTQPRRISLRANLPAAWQVLAQRHCWPLALWLEQALEQLPLTPPGITDELPGT